MRLAVKIITAFFALLLILILIALISNNDNSQEIIDRYKNIPADAVKMGPETDIYPPILHSEEYEQPIIVSAISSAGAEDSPFIPHDREELYFVFVPDVKVPIEKQVLDKTIGIYVSKFLNGEWQEPEKVILQSRNKLSLDGCEFVEGNAMLFCSAREGYTGMHWFSAEYKDEKWGNWKLADNIVKTEEFDTGELHIWNDELYFHSTREGGKGGYDNWMSKKVNGEWQEPVNLEAVNTADNEGWPYITQDGKELWFNRFYNGSPGVFKSERINGEWQEPELIVSQFAGEPTLDKTGNLYFVHHYYKDGNMIEADIYVAMRKD